MRFRKEGFYPAIVLMLVAGAVRAQPDLQLWVSPGGSDAASGSSDEPLQSLEGARLRVREALKKGTARVDVVFRDGDYLLSRTQIFGLEDSPGESGRVVYRAEHPGRAVFSSAFPVEGWRPVKDRPGLWEADLAGFDRFLAVKPWQNVLCRDGKVLPRSRGPGFLPEGKFLKDFTGPMISMNRPDCYTNLNILYAPKGILQSWANFDDVELFIRPARNWLVNILPAQSVDLTENKLITAVDGTYTLERIVLNPNGYCAETAWIEGAVENLDLEGEWAIDRRAGRLYLVSGQPPSGVAMPVLTELIRVEGFNSDDSDKPVHNLTFEGFCVTGTDRRKWDGKLKGLQHDWDFFDLDNAAIRFRGAQGCAVKNCRFVQTGENAVRLDLYAQENDISGNWFEDIGATAVLLLGYGPGTKDVNKKNLISNNRITRCGRILWHGMGVYIWQSGQNHIVHNYIDDMPYIGIAITGMRARFFSTIPPGKRMIFLPQGELHPPDRRELKLTVRWNELPDPTSYYNIFPHLHARENYIGFNEIGNCVRMLHDGNGIYLSAQGGDNVVDNNLVYYVMGTCIRPDDDSFDTTIKNNLLLYGYSGIRLKHVNQAVNNIIVLNSGGEAIRYNYHGDQLNAVPGLKPPLIEKNILAVAGKKLPPLYASMKYVPEFITIASNTVWNGSQQKTEEYLAQRQKSGEEIGSIILPPDFIDLETLKIDFSTVLEPLQKTGFVPPDIESIGLLEEPSFKRIRRNGPPRELGKMFEESMVVPFRE